MNSRRCLDHWVADNKSLPLLQGGAASPKGAVSLHLSLFLMQQAGGLTASPWREGSCPLYSTIWLASQGAKSGKWGRRILGPTSTMATSLQRKYQLAVASQGPSCRLQEDGPGWAAATRTPHGQAWGEIKTIRSKAKQRPGRMNPKWHSRTLQFCVNVWCILYFLRLTVDRSFIPCTPDSRVALFILTPTNEFPILFPWFTNTLTLTTKRGTNSFSFYSNFVLMYTWRAESLLIIVCV